MGKRNAAKRMKTASEVNTSAWFEETGRVRGPRLQAIDGGRSWHPDDADQKQYKRAATAPEGDRAQRYQKNVKPRSENQARLMEAMDEYALVAALGPAGTGKTYLAICKAVEALQKGKVSRIILSRPAVEAGEQLGFLPGDMREKVDPYLRPLYDARVAKQDATQAYTRSNPFQPH